MFWLWTPICWLLGSDLSSHWTTVLGSWEVLSHTKHVLVICSRGVTADTSTVPAHFSSAPLPPQGLRICTMVHGHTVYSSLGFWPLTGSPLGSLGPQEPIEFSLFPQARKDLFVWFGEELSSSFPLCKLLSPSLRPPSIGPPNSPLGSAEIRVRRMRNPHQPLNVRIHLKNGGFFLFLIFKTVALKYYFILITEFWWLLKFCCQA